VLRALDDEGVTARVLEREPWLEERMRSLKGEAGVFDVRGLGFLWGVELAQDRDGTPFAREKDVAARVQDACRERGVLVHTATGCAGDGRGDLVLVAPPLVTEDAVLVEMVETLRASIRSVMETVAAEG
jgi:adenosylmethionine-8-amino-7-oxononanoate aminotransferase